MRRVVGFTCFFVGLGALSSIFVALLLFVSTALRTVGLFLEEIPG